MVLTLNMVCFQNVANGMSNICMVFFKSFIGVKSHNYNTINYNMRFLSGFPT